MEAKNNDLEILAQRVQEGDPEAKGQLKQRLESSMVRIVRRVLERGHADTSLERKILVAARRLAANARPGPNDSRTIPVAQNLCQMVVNRLWPGVTEVSWQATMTA